MSSTLSRLPRGSSTTQAFWVASRMTGTRILSLLMPDEYNLNEPDAATVSSSIQLKTISEGRTAMCGDAEVYQGLETHVE